MSLYKQHFQSNKDGSYMHKNCGGQLGLVLDKKKGNHYWICSKCGDIFTIKLN